MLKWILLAAFALWGSGCAATVYPQPQPVHPTAVYVADYGIHSSLIMPTGDGQYIEYAFGDWYYAALNHCLPTDALGALLISFQSTLGRRYVEVPPGQTTPQPLHPSPNRIQVIYASQDSVDRLLRNLDARYRADSTRVVHNPDNDMDYVPDHEHYSVLNNCNHLTARCLRDIGCDVHGIVVLSKFSVAPTQREIAPDPAAHTASAQKGVLPSAQAN